MTGGERIGNHGYFQPTVLANVPDTARVMQEEPFGPLAVNRRCPRWTGRSNARTRFLYGLAAYGFTHNAANVDRMVEGVECGNLSINTLGHRCRKRPSAASSPQAMGREGGAEGCTIT